MRRYIKSCMFGLLMLAVCSVVTAQSQKSSTPPDKQSKKAASARAGNGYRPDIVTAVKAAAQKDCGCGACAAKGCEPCRGKNCYYCVAKALVANECGCGGCDAKGCGMCGPGCDVCKFHLAPVAEAKEHAQKQKK